MFQSADLVVASDFPRVDAIDTVSYLVLQTYNHEAIQSKEVLGCLLSVYEWLGQGRLIVEDTR